MDIVNKTIEIFNESPQQRLLQHRIVKALEIQREIDKRLNKKKSPELVKKKAEQSAEVG